MAEVTGRGVEAGASAVAYSPIIQLIPSQSGASPAFTRPPEDGLAVLGDAVTFHTSATGSLPIHYQWWHEDEPVPGGTNAVLTLPDVSWDAAGEYRVTATNDFGEAASGVAVLAVTNLAKAVLPPSLAEVEGGSASRTLRSGQRLQQVYGSALFPQQPLLIHQLRWRPSASAGEAFEAPVNNLEIRLSTSSAQPNSLAISFAANTGPDETLVFSGPARLHSAFVGPDAGPKAFDMVLSFSEPFLFHPAEGNLLVDIRNAASSPAAFVDHSLALSDGASRAFVSNPQAGFASNTDVGADVVQWVYSNPDQLMELSLLRQPEDQSVLEASTVRWQVTPLGPWPIHYQWHRDGEPLASQTNRYLELRDVQISQSGLYRVAVSNAVGSLISDPAELRVTRPPPAAILRGPYLQNATPRTMAVQWRTDVPVPGGVHFGTDSNDLHRASRVATAKTNHLIELDGLQPDTRYYYAIVAEDSVLAGGSDHSFVTPPAQPKPTRVWVIGDSGTASQGSTWPQAVRDAYLEYTGERDTDVWLMLGDNAYFSGTDTEYQLAVFDVYQPLLRCVPLWSTIGNHETYSADGNGHFAYFDIFTLPESGEAGGRASGTERYYSFDYSNIHFVCLDSETSDKSPDGAMLSWLREDLSANTKEWVIAFWHSPPYSKGSHNSDFEGNLVQMRQWALPILESHGTDLVLCGHSHCYERSYPLQGHYGTSDTLLPSMIQDAGSGREEERGAYGAAGFGARQGTVYVVAGNAGQVSGGSLDHPAMFVSLNELGSLVLDVDGGRLDARFLRETGRIDDWFTILKPTGEGTFRLANIRVEGGTVTAAWDSEPGAVYRVESSPNLEQPYWQDVSGEIVAEGHNTIWAGPAASANEGRAFYRVLRVSP